MESDHDDAERLRRRQDDADADASRGPGIAGRGSPSMVAQTKSISSYPTAANRFFACAPAGVLGPEVEGGPGTVSTTGSTFFALNLGTAVPPSGTNVLCTYTRYRWVFRYDG